MSAGELSVQASGGVMAGEARQGLAGLPHQRGAGGWRVVGPGQGLGDRALGDIVGGVRHGADLGAKDRHAKSR